MNEKKAKIEIVKSLIKNHAAQHRLHVKRCQEAGRYYRNENDILRNGAKSRDSGPLRNADNRIPRNFHGLLVNQKAAYMFTSPPLFDTGSQSLNKQISEVLGNKYAKVCKDLCVSASNDECAWLHYWVDDKGKFQYAVVPSEQIIPVKSNNLTDELVAVLRTYRDIDFKTGKEIAVWEYWTEDACYSYCRRSSTVSASGLTEYPMFQMGCDDESADGTNVYAHEMGRVPFIPFRNNNTGTNDLVNIKSLVDAYDKVFSSFLNDLEDIQEIIFVLTNYGGQDKKEFLEDLKKYKMIKIDSDEGDTKSGLETLTISIPIEAREKFLEITRKAIFEQGMGLDPDPQKFGGASGVALKYLYSLLDLKAGLTETEFKSGFGELVEVICRYLGKECGSVIQTWTRTAIRNDLELADIATKSVGTVSNKTILKNHPFVEDADAEERQIAKEQEAAKQADDPYQQAFRKKKQQIADDEQPEDDGDGKDES